MAQAKKRAPARVNGRAPANGRASARRTARLEAETSVPIEEVVAGAEAEAQAEFEGAGAGDRFEFLGESFRVNSKVGYMPLLKFAHEAVKGTDSGDLEGMAAMYDMLRSCLYRGQPACGQCEACTGDDPEPELCPDFETGEWARFEAHATERDADDEDLFGVIGAVLELVLKGRSRRGSGSAVSPSRTSPRSRAGSRSPAGAEGMVPVSALAR